MIDTRITTLYTLLDEHVRHYPPLAIERMRAFVFGTAFFPAGAGLVMPRKTLPREPIAIVAHVFDAPSYEYAIGPGNGSEPFERNRTWRGLHRLLDRAGISLDDCWLTNALMGVKVGAPCGRVAAGPEYRRACAEFLQLQIETVRPRIVVTLGTSAMLVLRAASPDLGERWRNHGSLDALDRAEPPKSCEAQVRFRAHTVTRVVALAHTCSWTGRRRYDGECGHLADAALLRDAVAATWLEPAGVAKRTCASTL